MYKTNDPAFLANVDCSTWWSAHSEAITVTEYPITITFRTQSAEDATLNWHTPVAVLYRSNDGKVGPIPGEDAPNGYREFSYIRSDAYGVKTHVASFQYESVHLPNWQNWPTWLEEQRAGTTCTVTAVRYGRYVLVRIENAGMISNATTTLAAEDEDQPVYLCITGESCTMTDFTLSRESEPIGPGTIEPATLSKEFIPTTVGDIPNVDCSGWWVDHSDGIELTYEPVTVTYHTISYPSARETWHAPFCVLFSSLDRLVGGIAYTEYSVTRSDGFGWVTDGTGYGVKEIRDASFISNDNWLSRNKKGCECTLVAYRKNDMVVIEQTNNGITVVSHTLIPLSVDLPIYLSLSGELCAITNIRISR